MLLGEGKFAQALVDHGQIVAELRRSKVVGRGQRFEVGRSLFVKRRCAGFASIKVQQRCELHAQPGAFGEKIWAVPSQFQAFPVACFGFIDLFDFAFHISERLQRLAELGDMFVTFGAVIARFH